VSDGRIQRFPGALLPLLSIKSDETPQILGGRVDPSLEMFPFYVSERLEVVAASSNGLSAIGSILLPIPLGEFWYVETVMALASNVTAASAIKLTCGYTDRAGSNIQVAAMTAPVASVATELFTVQDVVKLVLPPGFQLFASQIVEPGAGTLDLSVRAMIARLQPS
jgi:hypothetical protein